MKSIVKSAIAAAAFAAASVASASSVTFDFADQIFIGYPATYTESAGGLSVTVTGFSANGAPAALDVDWLLGLGVVEYKSKWVPFFGTITYPEADKRVEGGEYLVFKFSEAVTLNNFKLLDLPFSTNSFLLNGSPVSTHGLTTPIGLTDTFVFKSTHDAFRVKSLTVTPVPEPESVALLLAGLGVVGFVAARRQRSL